ncbi:hypothetical protein BG000_002400, partial [Podila horticola]
DTPHDDIISQVPVFASTESRSASVIAAGKRDPYTWDFETFSQANYYGDRQRFNGDGCVNFRCVNVRAYKGQPDKEYIFYDGDDCYGAVLLLTIQEKMSTELVIYPQPSYKGKPLTFVGLNRCHELKGDGVSSFQGRDSSTYTFYKDAGSKGTVLETSKGPNSRTNTYMTPMSVRID